MDDKRVFSTEVAPVALNDSSQDLESHKIYKCHSKKRDDTQNEGSSQDVIACNNIPAIYIETSDEDDTSEGLSGDVEQTKTQLPLATNLGSSVDCGGDFAYYISAMNYNLEILKEKYFKAILSLLTKIMTVVLLTKNISSDKKNIAKEIFVNCII